MKTVSVALLWCCLLAAASAATAADCNASSFGSVPLLRSQLNALCDGTARSSPGLPACTLWRTCNSALASPLCDPIVVFSTLCTEAPGTGACQKFKSSFASQAEADTCLSSKAATLPMNDVVFSAIKGMCSVHNMTGCSECGGGNCRDPLGTYALMCLEMKMSQCTTWTSMCKTVGANGALGSLCTQTATVPLPDTPCLANSGLAECKGYTYLDTQAVADIEALCSSMPSMSSCSVWSSCKASELKGTYCHPFNALATACHEMPGMSGCQNYKRLCMTGNSTVQQCSDYPGVPRLPTMMAAEKASHDMCEEHAMSNCGLCTKASGGCPDPLSALTALCKEMGSMSQCSMYHSWCDAAGSEMGAYCTVTSEDIPPMSMWLHQRLAEVVLSVDWITRTPAAYAGTVLAIIAFGVASTALKVARGRFDAQWIHDSLCSHAGAAARGLDDGACCSKHAASPKGRLQQLLALTATQNTIRALLTGGSSFLDYINMLIVMTFNIGFLCAAVGGYMLGTVLMSHLVVPQHGRRRKQAKRDPRAIASAAGGAAWIKGAFMQLRSSQDGSSNAGKDVEQGHGLPVGTDVSDPGSASGSGSEGEEEGGCPACAACAADTANGHELDQQASHADSAAAAAAAAAARSSAYQQAAVHHAGDGCC